MKEQTRNNKQVANQEVHSTESGAARLKFIIVLAILACAAVFLYNYVPVGYNAYLFKDYMQHEVDVAAASGFDENWLKAQITKSEADYAVPQNAEVITKKNEGRMELTVRFKKQVEFPGYVYDYDFDNTVKSTQFLMSTGH